MRFARVLITPTLCFCCLLLLLLLLLLFSFVFDSGT